MSCDLQATILQSSALSILLRKAAKHRPEDPAGRVAKLSFDMCANYNCTSHELGTCP